MEMNLFIMNSWTNNKAELFNMKSDSFHTELKIKKRKLKNLNAKNKKEPQYYEKW